MHYIWVHPEGGYVAFLDNKGDAQRPAAVRVIEAQPCVIGNPHEFPSAETHGSFTAVISCLNRACKLAGISGVTPHTLGHTFGSVAGDFGFSELTIRAMLDHASQKVTQDYVHIDEALKLAVRMTSDEIEKAARTGRQEARCD